MSSADYIQHHLKHWVVATPLGDLNLDTVLISFSLAIAFYVVMRLVLSSFSVHEPGRLQLSCESLIDFVKDQVDGIGVHESIRSLVGALALTVFSWVFLMNCMDLIPVDLPLKLASLSGIGEFRAVPTADMNLTIALALGVVLVSEGVLFYLNGFLGGCHILISQPFGVFLAPINVVKHVVGVFSKIVSLALRLFGNLYGGELIFILIAGLVPLSMQWAPYWAWMGLHLLIVSLQAFIFMVLTIIYIGMVKHTQAKANS